MIETLLWLAQSDQLEYQAPELPAIVAEISQETTPEYVASMDEVCGDDSSYYCNCWLYVQTLLPLSRTSEVHSNTPPKVGVLAFFSYDGVPHYAYVTKLHAHTFKVTECNYTRGKCGTRDVSYDDEALRGFYDPTAPKYTFTLLPSSLAFLFYQKP